MGVFRDTTRAPKPTIQYHAIPYDTMPSHKMQSNSMQYHTIPCVQWNNMHFWSIKGPFRQLGPYNGLPSDQTAIFRKTEGIQSYLRICGCYDLIRSSSSEPKNGILWV